MEHAHRRPDVFTYSDANVFVRDMLQWKKAAEPSFSVRQQTRTLRRCSPALVTLIARGERRLSPDRVPEFAKLLRLSAHERRALFALVGSDDLGEESAEKDAQNTTSRRQVKKNARQSIRSGLFQPWFNLYLWESARLSAFKPDASHLFRLLRGIAQPALLAKSIRTLMSEGFLRRTLEGSTVPEYPTIESTDEVPDERIRRLHVKSLWLAARLIDEVPVAEREAGLVLMSLDEAGFQKLKALLKKFTDELGRFSEEHAAGGDCLYQVLVNAVPVSVRLQEKDPS
jgi:uncharacterized protein (TIGR02147 family)